MSLVDRLERLLEARPSVEGVRVDGWRFELATGASFRAGVRGGELGGPYESPSFAVGIGGWLELRWSDGLVTSSSVDRSVADVLAERLGAWRTSAFPDPWIAPIPGPCEVPTVQAADPRLAEMLVGDPVPLLSMIHRMRKQIEPAGLRHVDLSLSAGAGRRWIRSSAGLRVEFAETAFSANVSAEELHWESVGTRRLPDEGEVDALVDRVGDTASALRREEELPGRELPVLLAPPVLEAFLGKFVQSNLGGQGVVSGHSTFSLEDFRERRAVFRDDIDLVIDTTLPFELATSPCSSEGVPAGRVALVAGGRLATPALSLKSAGRAGLPPTPAPRGYPSLLLEPRTPMLEFESALAALDPGLIVSFVIGLHTQNARTGRYSVVAPQAQVARRGALGGRARARLTGSFLDDLRDTASRFVRFPHQRNPGLLMRCSVSGDRG